MPPSAFDFRFSTAYPQIAAVAGFVPCAESGISTFLRGLPCDSCHARTSRIPVNSPCAPAAGCSVIASMPVISSRQCCSRSMISSTPCASDPADKDAPPPAPRSASHKLIHPRVVLHRARAQRIHAQIDGVVPRREPREVANDLDLAQLRAARRRLRDALRPAAPRHRQPAHPAAAACTRFLPGDDFSKPAPRSASGAHELCRVSSATNLASVCVAIYGPYHQPSRPPAPSPRHRSARA